MKFDTREDIDAPIDVVYDHLRDFDKFERQMLRRGIDVRRDETCPLDDVGARWQARVDWRGKVYDVIAELVSAEPNQGYAIDLRTSGVKGMTVVDLVALSKTRTRLFVSCDLAATTLSARLLLQSLKLARRRLSEGFAARVHRLAQSIPTS